MLHGHHHMSKICCDFECQHGDKCKGFPRIEQYMYSVHTQKKISTLKPQCLWWQYKLALGDMAKQLYHDNLIKYKILPLCNKIHLRQFLWKKSLKRNYKVSVVVYFWSFLIHVYNVLVTLFSALQLIIYSLFYCEFFLIFFFTTVTALDVGESGLFLL